MKSLAKKLRANMTEAEQRLWYHLRAKRFNGFKFRRQLVIEPYIVDFACLQAKLIIEADGGQHQQDKTRDDERTRSLEKRGYRVLRFWNHEVLNETEAVLERIDTELKNTP